MDSNVTFPERWTPPAELSVPLPRPASLDVSGVVLGALLLVVFGGFVLGTLYGGAREIAVSTKLRRESREAAGMVTRLRTRGTTRVTYAFSADGVAFTGQCSVSLDHWRGLRKGGPLPIRFLPSDPGINHPAAWEGPEGDWWSPCVPSTPLAALGIWSLISVRRRRQLQAEGLPTAGVVVTCNRFPGGWVARYQFRTQDGCVVAGSDKVRERLDIGTTICVLHLPQHPRRNLVYRSSPATR